MTQSTELMGFRIKRPEDIGKFISDPTERNFARFILDHRKEYKLYYERYLYTKEEELPGGVVTRITRPDFYFVNKRNGHSFHVEITTAPREHKVKQQEVMMDQGVRYLVFGDKSLRKLEKKYGVELLHIPEKHRLYVA